VLVGLQDIEQVQRALHRVHGVRWCGHAAFGYQKVLTAITQ
jgi:hypothetical protein